MKLHRSFAFRLLVLTTVWISVVTNAQADERVFRAGAALIDVTPELGVLMDGTISQVGLALRVHDPLHSRALVLDDGQTRLAIVIVDSTMIGRSLTDEAKRLIQQQTGLPTNRVLIAATHSHNTPRASGLWDQPAYLQYERELPGRIAASVKQAVENLAPAKIGWGSFDRPDLVKTRRWIWKPGTTPANPFGETGEDVKSLSWKGPNAVRPAGPVDPQFFVLAVRHADGSPLALLGNFNIHYAGGGRRGEVSADYFGYFSQRIAELLSRESKSSEQHPPIIGLMSNGNSGSTTAALNVLGKQDHAYEVMQRVGYELADQARDLYRKITFHDHLPLNMREMELELAIRKPDEERVAWAEKIWEQARLKKEAGKRITWTEVYARENLLLSQWPASKKIKLQTIAIGDSDGLAITSGPYEMFAETGLALKKHSPFASTFNIELANGTAGYLPTSQQHQWGGYETWPARSSNLEIDAEEKIRNALLSLLEDLSH